MEEIKKVEQRAVLVGLSQGLKTEFDINESMNELAELTLAAGAEVADIIIQNKATIEAATFIGSGKVEEVKIAIQDTESNLVIFNDELSGAQMRNLEAQLETTVVDRTALILDIFASRAQTKIAKLQVELAQLKYRLPRLTGFGVSLSRTGGGIGTRGPGEQKLEIDKRHINERIDEIRRQIRDAEKNRIVQRQLREKNEVPIVALVGYTNAGKSSIMNYFIDHSLEGEDGRQVFEKDMLFATLDTFSRRIVLEDKKEFILTDTVGFVSKLPHSLIDAFKATLEEALGADLLLHVIDASNDSNIMQMEVTKQVLNDLKAGKKEIINVFNKMDLAPGTIIGSREEAVYVSAKTGENIDLLIEKIKKQLFSNMIKATFLVPYTDGKATSYLCQKYHVTKLEHLEQGTQIETEVSEADYGKYKQYLI